MKKKLCFIANVDWGFISFRLPIAQEAQKQGYEIHLITELTNKDNSVRTLKENNIYIHNMEFKRSNSNPVHLFFLLVKIIKKLKLIKPDIVHLITIKAVLIGGLAARIANINKVVIAITGLGYTFIQEGMIAQFRRFLLTLLYKASLNTKKVHLIFQNHDDRKEILEIVNNRDIKYSLIPGSGVNLSSFPYTEETIYDKPKVLMIGRLLKDKGILEFVEAANILKNREIKSEFIAIGEIDEGNPASLDGKSLKKISSLNLVNFKGYVKDVAKEIKESNIVVLPSYREGFPKALIEASSIGRALIACDVPGSREAVIHKENGLIVKPREAEDLAKAIEHLLNDDDRRKRMGLKSTAIAERKYDINKVVQTHIEIYKNKHDF